MYREVYTEEGTMSTPAGKIVLVQSDVTDPHRVMAYVDSSKTKVAGAEGRMQVARSIDMSSTKENGVSFEREHSAQFVWRIQRIWDFWKNVKRRLSGE